MQHLQGDELEDHCTTNTWTVSVPAGFLTQTCQTVQQSRTQARIWAGERGSPQAGFPSPHDTFQPEDCFNRTLLPK